jgi:nucleotide-binding universal stress UspA family protein
MSRPRTILHPTDFSDSSRYAFRLARALAREQGARLVVVHVQQTLPKVPHEELLDRHQLKAFQDKLRKVLDRFRSPDPGVRVEHRVVEGDPAEEILRQAGRTRCDLIVMGTHARTGLGSLFLGSVAQEVLRNAPCPVVTVKTPRRAGRPPAAEPAVTGTSAAAPRPAPPR